MLAFVNLVTGDQLDESIEMIKRAVALSPGSEEFLFVLAQLYLRKQDIEEARKVIEPLASTGADPQIRARAGVVARIDFFDAGSYGAISRRAEKSESQMSSSICRQTNPRIPILCLTSGTR